VTSPTDWEQHGIRIVGAGELDGNTPQTPGMTRAAAITYARAGARKLWAGTVVVEPDVATGPHHHGELETVLYIVRGRARFRWGDRLEFVAEAGPGDFIYVPRLCRTRRSTRCRTPRWRRWWCAAGKNRW